MTEKELKHLSRSELLELLLTQTRENERLREKLKQKEAQLSNRILQVQKAGDLAHAVLEINGVMEAAQAAAQQYLDNMEQLERRTQEACQQMLAEARKQAAEIQQENRKREKEEDPDNGLIAEIYDIINK